MLHLQLCSQLRLLSFEELSLLLPLLPLLHQVLLMLHMLLEQVTITDSSKLLIVTDLLQVVCPFLLPLLVMHAFHHQIVLVPDITSNTVTLLCKFLIVTCLQLLVLYLSRTLQLSVVLNL